MILNCYTLIEKHAGLVEIFFLLQYYVAHSIERRDSIPEVVGSIPTVVGFSTSPMWFSLTVAL